MAKNLPQVISDLKNGKGVFVGSPLFVRDDGSVVDVNEREQFPASALGKAAYDEFEGMSAPSDVSGAISTHNNDAGAHADKQTKVISDVGNYFTTDTVEGALQEIGAKAAKDSTIRKNTICLLGDSITALNGPGTTPTSWRLSGSGYFTWANIFLNQRLTMLNNSSVGGYTTAQMLAVLQTGVIAYNPEYCLVLGGINDVISSVSTSTTISNLQEIYETLLDNGCVAIVSKILPSSMINTTALATKLNQINKFITDFSKNNNNVLLLDLGKYFNTASTGFPPAALAPDGTHPNYQGAFYIGKAIYEALKDRIPDIPFMGLSNLATDALNANPMMLGGTSGSVETGYYSPPPTQATTFSKEVRTDISGEWEVLTVGSMSTGVDQFRLYTAVPAAPGDVFYMQMEINASALTNVKNLYLDLLVRDSSHAIIATSNILYANTGLFTIPAFSGILKTVPIVVPSGGAEIVFALSYNLSGVIKIGRTEICKV